MLIKINLDIFFLVYPTFNYPLHQIKDSEAENNNYIWKPFCKENWQLYLEYVPVQKNYVNWFDGGFHTGFSSCRGVLSRVAKFGGAASDYSRFSALWVGTTFPVGGWCVWMLQIKADMSI